LLLEQIRNTEQAILQEIQRDRERLERKNANMEEPLHCIIEIEKRHKQWHVKFQHMKINCAVTIITQIKILQNYLPPYNNYCLWCNFLIPDSVIQLLKLLIVIWTEFNLLKKVNVAHASDFFLWNFQTMG